jgi:hypothetical protein
VINHRLPYEVEDRGDEKVERHESFGLLSIHRIQGHAPLFASHLDRQYTHFVLEVKRADVGHSLSRDWHYARQQVIEIRMSAAQFAEAITTLNMGTGTPCTISRILGEELEPPPQHRESEAKKIRSSFKDDLREFAKSLSDKVKAVDQILEKKAISVADKKQISGVLHSALQEVKDNLPFVLSSFQESTEKVVSQAKAEVDAFLSLSMHKLGVESMHQKIQAGESPAKALTADSATCRCGPNDSCPRCDPLG